MSSVNYENQILDAIDTMVNNAVAKAGYDKTIKAVIVSLEDATKGRYKVKYQDSEIEAYSNNVDKYYTEGTLVYVLVPNNDFTQTKTILDIVDKNNIEHTTVLEEDKQYVTESGNCIAANQTFGLCSYHKNEIVYLYSRDGGINNIFLDTYLFKEAIENNNQILCGAKFKTAFDNIQKRTGDFGIVFEIDYSDNLSGDIITKEYRIDVNRMSGTPYDLRNFTRQYGIFKINNENFKSIKSIYIYCNNFAVEDEDSKITDILVNDFELSVIKSLTIEELNSYNLNLNKEGQGYFDEFSQDTDDVRIIATLFEGGNAVKSLDNIDFYWFKQNNNISINDEKYVGFGGEGWECVNKYNSVDDGQNMWLTKDTWYSITKAEIYGAITHIKCVAVKDGTVIAEKVTSIYNYNPTHKVEIVSDQGIQFYFDNGNPTLTCIVDDGIDNHLYDFKWVSEDINGVITNLVDTEEANNTYNAAAADYELLEAQIQTETAMPAANEERLNGLKAIVDSYDYIQRVEGNKIHHIDLTQIIDKTIFRCTVSYRGNIIGTSEIAINNSLVIEGNYKLNILNGTQTFNYEYRGFAPTSKAFEKPLTILPLSFEIIDNLGNKFTNKVLSTCNVQWTVPNNDTMLIGENSKELILPYTIAEKYNAKKTNNTINLTVSYKNLTLEADTAFTFVKDGYPGVNGTGIVCKIIPNTEEIFTDEVMLINGVPNFTPAAAGKWFKVQVWESGSPIYEGIDGDSNFNVEWSILQNTYTRKNGSNISDPATIGVSGSTFSYLGYAADAACIIKVKVTYQDTEYYASYPVIITVVNDDNYTAKLVNGTGFKYVMYKSDGKNPQYDNTNPFEIQVRRLIGRYWEDISTIDNQYAISYEWAIKGKIYSVNNDRFVDDHYLTFANNSNLARNQKFLIPNEDYDGENVTNALEVKILDGNLTEKIKLLIPIHFYLDREGIAALADWDGNKISINNDTGAILAPQVGAGRKETDKTFSGVLMGTVKERGSDQYEQGLFGYYHGQRSIFLDSDTGKAIFGLEKKGQVIIDPTSQTAKLYGGNYVAGSSGLLIDLTTPEIRFGNGNFSVTSNGYLTAKGGGSIAGWNISKQGTRDVLSAGNIILNSEGSISGGSGDLTWSINKEGKATFNGAEIHGSIYASGGSIGGWSMDASRIYSSNGLSYLNSDGSAKFGNISIASNGAITASGGNFNDITTNRLTVNYGTINDATGNRLTVNYGTFNNITVNKGTFNGTLDGATGSFNGSLSVGNRFSVDKNGVLIAYTSGGGYLTMGAGTVNPKVSGLTVGGNGIDCSSAGIRAYSYIVDGKYGYYTGKTLYPDSQAHSIQWTNSHGDLFTMAVVNGLIVGFALNGEDITK